MRKVASLVFWLFVFLFLSGVMDALKNPVNGG